MEKQVSVKKMDVPEGFAPVERPGPFADINGPLYFKEAGGALVIGLLVESRHCNAKGTLHGGMIAAVADVAMGENIGYASLPAELVARWREDKSVDIGPRKNLVTVTLSTDYIGGATVGDWIEVNVQIGKVGKTLAFASAWILRNSEIIARCSAVFRDRGSERS
jgi:acyl-coenzyme A thioesterase 13